MSDGAQGVTYAEVRRWAAWLMTFTARDLAGALHSSLEVGQRGVKALLHQRICEVISEDYPGPDGPERLIGYIPLPAGPREHYTETPPEILVPRQMGGDPLRQPRGMPVGQQRFGRSSVAGQWRPGRRQGPSRAPAKKGS